MDVFEAIEKRHSYRGAYTDAPVSRDDLKRIGEAGLKAPSGCNTQTTTFVIVDDPAAMDVLRTTHTMRAVKEAKAFIVCCIAKDPKHVYRDHSFEVEDCSAAVQNMLLAAIALGYGTVWIDGALRYDGHAERIDAALGVPADRTARVLLPIGVPVEEGPRKTKMPFEQRAQFNRHV